MNETNYQDFIKSKIKTQKTLGFNPIPLTAPLFEWQAQVCKWAIKKGRAALFEDCGLGKTAQQLEWAHQVAQFTSGSVLILTPLSVSSQTQSEAVKFAIPAKVIQCDSDVDGGGVFITNYEKIDNIDCSVFAGVVLDESSILKSFDGKTLAKLIKNFAKTPFKLCCTATPSPNDYTELGNHAEFLGVCSRVEMLSEFFVNDTFNTGDWRLKKHAAKPFWAWVSSWAACVSKPSDIGFSDIGYILPSLNMEVVDVKVDESEGKGDNLFRVSTLSATTMHADMRITAESRTDAVAKRCNESNDCFVVWCNTNLESDLLRKKIPDSVEVKGSDKESVKLDRLNGFKSGKYRVMITKPSIAGFGLNWQHCHNVCFVGLSYSFEDFYQALRRTYRFGQESQVNAFIYQASTEANIMKVIKDKMKKHQEMKESMKEASKELVNQMTEVKDVGTMNGSFELEHGEGWTVINGDCVIGARAHIADHSCGLSVFSPPFADLFTYSSDPQDMGNCQDLSHFMIQFDYLIQEIKRVMMPGREVCVHCVDLLTTMWKHGRVEFQDFGGEIIRAFWKHGFHFHSRVTIWKDPVVEMQRTKAHGLLHKTLKSDSTKSRVGCADYLLVFKSPGENTVPVTKDADKYPVSWWQEAASPVWMTVDQGNVLNGKNARENEDEKHICPLQLDVIQRAIELWSNSDEVVYSPFTGIGSEGFMALKLGRKFIGTELKRSYFEQAVTCLKTCNSQLELF